MLKCLKLSAHVYTPWINTVWTEVSKYLQLANIAVFCLSSSLQLAGKHWFVSSVFSKTKGWMFRSEDFSRRASAAHPASLLCAGSVSPLKRNERRRGFWHPEDWAGTTWQELLIQRKDPLTFETWSCLCCVFFSIWGPSLLSTSPPLPSSHISLTDLMTAR